jgi:hypothetical protein
MPADLANNAAAVAEGYVRVQLDYGAGGTVTRYVTRYEKQYDGDAQSGGMRVIEGRDPTAQATADTNALNTLNAHRRATSTAPTRPT